MTLIVCPNLAVDRILTSGSFHAGETTRCRALWQQAGGKGANVLRALRILRGTTAPADLLLGFVAGHVGRLFLHLADEEGLTIAPVGCGGEMRVSTILLADDLSVTRLYELGPAIGPDDEERLLADVAARPAVPGEWAVVDGAAPPGASRGFYGAISSTLRDAGYRVLVDAADEQLAHSLPAAPDLVKVNLAEARSAVGAASTSHIRTRDERPNDAAAEIEGLELCRRLVAAGAVDAVVTLAAAGAVALLGGRELRITSPPVIAVNPVGSGDCFAAGMIDSLEGQQPFEAALALAAGAASANAASRINGSFELELARELAGGARVGPPACCH